MRERDDFDAYFMQRPDVAMLVDEAERVAGHHAAGLGIPAKPDATILVTATWAVSQAEETLGGGSQRTVRAWLSQGRIPRTRLGSRTMAKEPDLESIGRERQRRGKENGRKAGRRRGQHRG